MMFDALKNIIRPIYFQIFRLLGYPGVDLYKGKIVEIIQEYDQVWTYRVSKPKGFNYTAGQYAHLIAPHGYINPRYVRHMSFASAPNEPDLLFSMDASSQSEFKQKFRGAKVGDKIGVYNVRGQFTLTALSVETPVVFIAGGIGITPIRSLIADTPKQPWHLVYAGRGYCYRKLFDKVASSENVTYTDREGVFLAIEKALKPQAHYFICGSQGFINDIQAFLINHSIGESNIHLESFGD